MRSLRPPAAACRLLVLLVVLVVAAACGDYSPTDPGAEPKALTLSPATAEIPADGVSRLTLTAEIDSRAAADRRTVVFTATAGTIVGATEENGRKLSLAADSAGRARIELQSERTVRTAVVTASITAGTETLALERAEVRFVAADPGTLVRISTSAASAPADGATAVRVFADVAAGLPDGQRTVTFTTTLGSFADAAAATPRTTTATAGVGQRATVDLLGPIDQVGEARVTATVAGTTAQTFVEFVRAFPDTVIVSPSKTSLVATPTDSLTATVTLLRNVGKVTKDTIVEYQVIDPETDADLRFPIVGILPSDLAGVSTATVSAGSTMHRGTATIVATVSGPGVRGEVDIEIVAPPPPP
jgi:hypothetical protein